MSESVKNITIGGDHGSSGPGRFRLVVSRPDDPRAKGQLQTANCKLQTATPRHQDHTGRSGLVLYAGRNTWELALQLATRLSRPDHPIIVAPISFLPLKGEMSAIMADRGVTLSNHSSKHHAK